MKKLIVSVLLNLFVCGIAFGQTAPAPVIVDKAATVTKKTPPLNLADLVGLKNQAAPQFVLPATDGTVFNLADLRGKIVVVNLWGTFCPPCIVEMPELNRLVEKYKNQDVVFLAPTPDDKAVLEGFLRKNPFDYKVLPNGFKVIEQYAPHKKSVDGQKKGGFMMLLPTHLVIDKAGVVTFHEWGFSKTMSCRLTIEIERLLNEESSKEAAAKK